MEYRQTQIGYTLIIVLSSVLLLLLWRTLASRDGSGASFAFFVVAVCLLLFPTLTVEIGNGNLIWKFGLGILRKQVPLAEIARTTPVRTNVLQGWGIHRTRGGWFYNVSGFDAIEVELKSGKKFILGTDEPKALMSALSAHIGSRGADSNWPGSMESNQSKPSNFKK